MPNKNKTNPLVLKAMKKYYNKQLEIDPIAFRKKKLSIVNKSRTKLKLLKKIESEQRKRKLIVLGELPYRLQDYGNISPAQTYLLGQ